jgi:hypothetical protein
VSHAGGALLAETVRASGLDRVLSAGLARWRRPHAVHDPAKVLTDLVIALALGGDCLADIAVLRAEAGLFGAVASDPTVSRTLAVLAGDVTAALAVIDSARAAARARVWALAGRTPPTRRPVPRRRWSSTWTRPWSPRTATRKRPRRRSNAATGSIHCGASPTTARRAAGSHSGCCCGPVMPAPTPPPTTSPS